MICINFILEEKFSLYKDCMGLYFISYLDEFLNLMDNLRRKRILKFYIIFILFDV